MVLGAGRETVESAIDPAVGLVLGKKVGDAVAKGEPLVTLHVNDTAREKDAVELIRSAIHVGPAAPPPTKLVRLVIQ
jgi:pyrimidine-nucleoside phosphorylase